MSIENPLDKPPASLEAEAKEEKQEYKPIEGLSEAELESLEGDEKAFAEFIEKRNEAMQALAPLLELARSDMVAPEAKKKITESINFLGREAYGKYAAVDDERRAKIENGLIEERKAAMSPEEKEE
ncbi:MAG: hypothetical protein QF679_02805 [Candidatus Pacebacteria bacterium]|jgi:hypothetical protein|nr:hypothetical protein [Candidatus Paceibacterota bacterium]